MLRAFLLAVPFVLWAATCRAGDRLDCSNAITQAEMNQCAADDLTRADDELNQTYRALMAMLDPTRRRRLVEAERAWINFRDAHCRSETAQSEGGSIHPLLYDTCLADMTRKRTKELKASLDCERHGENCND